MSAARILLVAAALSAGTAGVHAQSDLFEKGKDGLVYAYTIEPPFTMRGSGGEPIGYGNEVAIMVLEEMGLSLKGQVVEWATLVPGVKAGRYDFAQQMYITPVRCAEVMFTRPVLRGLTALMVPSGNPKNITSYDDIIADPSITLVLLAGAAENGYAERAGIPRDQIQAYPDIPSMMAAMMSGRGDVMNLSVSTVGQLVEQSNGRMEMADATFPDWTTNWNGYAFRKEDADFVAAFNEALEKVIQTEEFQTVLSNYLGTSYGTPEERFPSADETAEMICNL